MATFADEKYEPPEARRDGNGDWDGNQDWDGGEKRAPAALSPLERAASQTYNYGAPGTMEPHAGTGLSLVEAEAHAGPPGHAGHAAQHQHQYVWSRLARPMAPPSAARYNVMM